MKKIIQILFLLSIVNLAIAQKSIKVSGIIRDSISLEPLPGATINVNYGEQNIVADNSGRFSFYSGKSDIIMVVRYVGYKPWRTQEILRSDKTYNIQLLQVSNDLEEVLVSSKNPASNIKKPLLGVNTISIKTLNKIPSAMGELDIMRGLQMLPGVSSVGEAANGVNIRGGATDQNLILLDDAPIFNPTHMFGLFSAFPSEAISSFDLYKGNVPTRFGGRAAAVLDVNLTNPNTEKFKMQGGISLVSNRILLDIPLIKNKMGISVSGRGAFNDFLLPLASKQLENIKAKFGDGSSKLFYIINTKNTLTLSSYYSNDYFQTEILGSINEVNSTNTQYKYQTFNNTLNWFHAINSNLNIQTKYINSNYQPTTLLPELNSENKVKIISGVKFNQIKSNLNYFKNNHKVEFGLDAIRYDINPGELDPGLNTNISKVKTQNEMAYETALYIEDEVEFSKKLVATGGIRYSYFMNMGPGSYRTYQPGQPRDEIALIDTVYIGSGKIQKSFGGLEPRLGIRYQLTSKKTLKLGYNLMRQYLQVVTNTTTPLPTSRWKTSDLYIKPQISNLLTVGYVQETESSIYEYSIEGYLRKTNNIVDYKPGADFLLQEYPESQLLQGKNSSYGLELMATKKKGEFTGWINYTYARSFNQVNEGPEVSQQVNQGDWYAANYDRPHTINSTLVINQGKHHDFSFNFTYSTGRPFTMPQGFIQYQDNTYPFYSLRNNSRIPDYHRLDFAWNIYNPSMDEKRRWKGNWTFTVYNLYGRKNAYSVFLKSEGTNIKSYKLTVFGAPIISLSYNFKFS
ncbi:MAG: TonB-dependent receptor plug domain-containing protein [Cytophagaceae bacterium]|nr:TonB-dependent receptor plug domain-containing protein [Cytophagaceae bacterium]